jgi:hypothetical protein
MTTETERKRAALTGGGAGDGVERLTADGLPLPAERVRSWIEVLRDGSGDTVLDAAACNHIADLLAALAAPPTPRGED